MAHSGLAFTMKTDPVTRRLQAHFSCGGHDCVSTHAVSANNVGQRPEQIRQMLAKAGWETDGYNPSRNRCPQCIAVRQQARRGESPKPLNGRTTNVTAPPAAPVATPDQRMKIRNLLDANFDDAKGRYLAGYSDEKIAQEVNIPRLVVTSIREAAYGPLRSDPEIERIHGMLADAEKRVADAQKGVDHAAADLKKIRAALEHFQLSMAT